MRRAIVRTFPEGILLAIPVTSTAPRKRYLAALRSAGPRSRITRKHCMQTRSTLPLVASLAILLACGGGTHDTMGPGGTPTPAEIERIAGDSQVAPAGTVLPDSLAVLVTDTGGHPVAGITVAWSTTGGGSVSPTSSQTDTLGIAKTSRTLGPNAGHGKTNAAVTGLTLLQFEAVSQIQGAVQISSQTVGTPTDTVLGTLIDPELRPSVLVVDQHGDPVAGVNVSWSATGGFVSTLTVPTDSNGVSTVGYTFGASTTFTYTATATVLGLIGSPVAIPLTATPGVPATLTKTAGDGASALPDGDLVQTVKVADAHGNGIAGIAIAWAAVGGVGAVTPALDTTGSNGQASTTRTMGSSSGIDSTTAHPTVATLTPDTVTFTASAATVVAVGNNFFNPTSRTIASGDSVQWAWQGTTVDHNITFTVATGVPANEPNRTSGIVWRVFDVPGTFNYHCSNHAGMAGTITVTP